VFWEVFHHSSVLRSELAAKLGVSPSTISRSLETLVECRLISESSATISGRGRRPGVLRVNPDVARLLGVEIDRDHITVVVTDMCGGLLGRASSRCKPAESLQGALDVTRKLAAVALEDAGIELAQIDRIGVGHTGALSLETGVCLAWGGAPEWRNVPIRQRVAELFRRDVTLDDRARAMAMAERLHSSHDARHRDAIYVAVGTGIGCGVFVGGRLVRGARQAAGELGHTVVDRNGPLCSCGANGCVEALASIPAILGRVRAAMAAGRPSGLAQVLGPNDALTIEDVVRAANHGDALARETLDDAGEALGAAVANAIQLLNPSLVVLCGKLAHAAREHLLQPVCRVIYRRCFEMASRRLEIRLAPFRKDVVAVGCALLAAQDQGALELQRRLDPATARPAPPTWGSREAGSGLPA
jgi:predicted NBD/HSP70 family sugar kinase